MKIIRKIYSFPPYPTPNKKQMKKSRKVLKTDKIKAMHRSYWREKP